MSATISQETRDTCTAYDRALACGEHPADIVGYLSAQYGVQRPAIWRRLIAGGSRPPYEGGSGKIGRAAAGVSRHKHRDIPASMLPTPVDRDPCPRCGVRRDIGCHHSLAPLGIAMGLC